MQPVMKLGNGGKKLNAGEKQKTNHAAKIAPSRAILWQIELHLVAFYEWTIRGQGNILVANERKATRMQTKTYRLILQFILVIMSGMDAAAQCSLQYFTNQANILLQSQFGFGVTNIPVYCPTNPAIDYNASIHYVLQGIANTYDATTPASNLPSVFRPTLAWQSNTLYIKGYVAVTNDGRDQVSRVFKHVTDPSITPADNVLGIPWVVGAKGQIPSFNEYCYASGVYFSRQLQFIRYPDPVHSGLYLTTRPPQFTNQFYIMAVSNEFGAEAWNSYPVPYTNPTTIFLHTEIGLTLTNSYDFATNVFLTNFISQTINSWPANHGTNGFIVPLNFNITSLPLCYWSESRQQLIPFANGQISFLPSDTNQTGWPVHSWVMNITNSLVYALIDNSSGSVLDLVNLDHFGSSLDFNQVLDTSIPGPPNFWVVPPATDFSDSQISEGALYQIDAGVETSSQFAFSLFGIPGGFPNTVGYFYPPDYILEPGAAPYFPAYAAFIQSCTWGAQNPLVHYTLEDLTNPTNNNFVLRLETYPVGQPISLDEINCTLGQMNLGFNSGIVKTEQDNFSRSNFEISFTGLPDLPYSIWASANLLDWRQIGTATQAAPGYFQFDDSTTTNYPNRFYQVRLP
jgi:hypothetical protein